MSSLALSSVLTCCLAFVIDDLGLKLVCFILVFDFGCNVVMFIFISRNIAPFMVVLFRLKNLANKMKYAALQAYTGKKIQETILTAKERLRK